MGPEGNSEKEMCLEGGGDVGIDSDTSQGCLEGRTPDHKGHLGLEVVEDLGVCTAHTYERARMHSRRVFARNKLSLTAQAPIAIFWRTATHIRWR